MHDASTSPLDETDRNGSDRRPLALVTGGSSGIGADLARELARDGYDLVLVARREAPMRALATELAELGARVTVIAANLSVYDAACRLVAHLEARGLADVDVLVSNAGFGDYASFAAAEPTRLSEMMRLNVIASTELIRALLPAMLRRRRGRIMIVAAVAGFAPGPGAAVYHGTKAFLLMFGQALAAELRGTGLTATTVCPGRTQSGFASAAGREDTPAQRSAQTMESATVARLAYRALKDGTRLCIPGCSNKIAASFFRHAPTRLVLAVVGQQNRRSHHDDGATLGRG